MCATPLTPHEARAGFLCGKPACHWQYRTLPASRRCDVCARPLTEPVGVSPVCARTQCKREFYFDRVQAAKAARQHALERQVGIWFAPAFAAHVDMNTSFTAADARSFRITGIPSNNATEGELSAERREIFHGHLTEMTREAFAHRDAVERDEAEPFLRLPTAPETPDMSTVTGAACAQCRGNCCRSGQNHAYITLRTIFAYIVDHPHQLADEVIATYESYLPARTLDPGCVYQRELGCALPRDMRSDVCNWFFCEPLAEFKRDQPAEAPVRAFFVQSSNGEPDEGLLTTASFVQLLRRVPDRQEKFEL